MNIFLRTLFFALFVRPIVFLWFGLNVRRRHLLPKKGPAIIVANHNSHLDTIVLMSSFSLRELTRVRPVAAADYWYPSGSSLKNRLVRWFSSQIVGVIPLNRQASGPRAASAAEHRKQVQQKLAPIHDTLKQDGIVIFYPEGTRGQPGKMQALKKGVSYLVEQQPSVPVFPIFLGNVHKMLPRHAWIPVPLFIDSWCAPPLWFDSQQDDRDTFLGRLSHQFELLQQESQKINEHF